MAIKEVEQEGARADALGRLIPDVEEYLRVHRLSWAVTTARTAGIILRRVARDLVQADPSLEGWSGVTTGHLVEWLESRKLSPSTTRAYVERLQRLFAWLMVTGRVETNPAAALEGPRIPQSLPRALSADEVRRLLNAPDTSTPRGIRDRAILEVALSSGVRVSELVALSIGDVDLSQAPATVLVRHGKGAQDRVTYLDAEAVRWVRRWLVIRERGDAPPQSDALLGDVATGRRLTDKAVQDLVPRYGRMAGIAGRVTPHDLRHTMATRLVLVGMPLPAIQALLGHRTLAATQIYVKLTALQVRAEFGKHSR
ncbi:MAG TPA: tyrosine-type recombinase/integrase [bacterium]|nr:tyrosine-type recombinase/integrase [bacterium]